MVPPVAVHVMAVLTVPVRVAMNCCVAPVVSDAVAGETATRTSGGVGLPPRLPGRTVKLLALEILPVRESCTVIEAVLFVARSEEVITATTRFEL